MNSKIEQMVEHAMTLAGENLSDYSSKKSRKDFTQRQLTTLLVLRLYLQTTYRGLLEFLARHRQIRKLLKMEEKLPHYTTLQKFGTRKETAKLAKEILATLQKSIR